MRASLAGPAPAQEHHAGAPLRACRVAELAQIALVVGSTTLIGLDYHRAHTVDLVLMLGDLLRGAWGALWVRSDEMLELRDGAALRADEALSVADGPPGSNAALERAAEFDPGIALGSDALSIDARSFELLRGWELLVVGVC